jgi:hypothetical protein
LGLIRAFVIGLIAFLPFPSWQFVLLTAFTAFTASGQLKGKSLDIRSGMCGFPGSPDSP